MERLNEKIETSPECWTWTAAKSRGYGQVWSGGSLRPAHRVVYEILVGEIPAGLELDHRCRNRGCVNPDHLEPVTSAENTRRGTAGEVNRSRQLAKTHCPQGHPYSGENLYVNPQGKRACKTCVAASQARYKARKRFHG